MKHFTFFALFIIFSVFSSGIFADTIILPGNNEIKGLIVDEYVDRVVISTFEGEKTFLRENIKSMQYEDTETRLLKLGNDAVKRTNYKAAAYYYRAVLKLNPNSIQARDGEIAAIRKELTSGAEIAKEDVALMTALEEPALSAGKDVVVSYEKNVRDLLGLKIKKSDAVSKYYVYNVSPESPAHDYGILKKDIISSVWNENVQYMTYEEMIKKLSGPEFSMVKLSIEREASFSNPKKIKLNTGLKEEGYFIKDVSGIRGAEKILIKPGDWLLEINSVSTRYIPKDEIDTLLSNAKAPLILLIKRDLYITREKGE
ncbi:MAG: PDZ domain-containing protein [Candidatus Omnitrophota bacterium]